MIGTVADKPITLYRLRVIAGTYTQDELFLLSDEELKSHAEDRLGEIPEKIRTKDGRMIPFRNRKQLEKYLNALGFGIEKTYGRNDEFIAPENLARRWPGKIGLVGTGNSTPSEYQMYAGETIQEFAERMAELANRETLKKEVSIHKSVSEGQGVSDGVISSLNENRDMFPKTQVTTQNKESDSSYIPHSFETWTVQQLREYAEDKEINLEGCQAKAQIVRRLREIEAQVTLEGNLE